MFKLTPPKLSSPDVEDDIMDIITPPSKGDNFLETPSSTQSAGPRGSLSAWFTTGTPNSSFDELQIQQDQRRPLGRFLSFDVRRSLFSSKRLNEEMDHTGLSPLSKKSKDQFEEIDENKPLCPVISALDQIAGDPDLVADGSRSCSLPTVKGKHPDLKCITKGTMAAVHQGEYDDVIGHVTVIDCRYPYEFEGGHIAGAINLYTKQDIQGFLLDNVAAVPNSVLVFHCEFSSERGPKLYRFLRSLDRDINKDHYPRLHFPEIYLLEGGYKVFFQNHPNLCNPCSYVPMLHKDHASELRHFRVKSKSWAAGEKSLNTKPSRTNLRF